MWSEVLTARHALGGGRKEEPAGTRTLYDMIFKPQWRWWLLPSSLHHEPIPLSKLYSKLSDCKHAENNDLERALASSPIKAH